MNELAGIQKLREKRNASEAVKRASESVGRDSKQTGKASKELREYSDLGAQEFVN